MDTCAFRGVSEVNGSIELEAASIKPTSPDPSAFFLLGFGLPSTDLGRTERGVSDHACETNEIETTTSYLPQLLHQPLMSIRNLRSHVKYRVRTWRYVKDQELTKVDCGTLCCSSSKG